LFLKTQTQQPTPKRRDRTLPFFLAGGLRPANVGGGVTAVCPGGVDVSSGVETDGVKDLAKVDAFVAAVRAADAARQGN
jgi:phosphoribosylanthranilate isomerase